MIHRPGISSLPIRSVHTASPLSSQVTQCAPPIGMNWSEASRTPIEPGTSPYRIGPFWLMWAKYDWLMVRPIGAWPYAKGRSIIPGIGLFDDRSVIKFEQYSPPPRRVAGWQWVRGDLIDRVPARVQAAKNSPQILDRVGIGQHLALGIDEPIGD